MTAKAQIRAMLKAACKEKVQWKVAAEIGISMSKLSEYMHGHTIPRLDSMQRIVNYTGKTITIKPEVK